MSPDQRNGHRLSDRALQLIERVLSFRYLSGLSDDKREELQEDLDFIRRTLIDQRPARIGVVGSRETDLPNLLHAITDGHVDGDLDVKSYLGRNRWYDYQVGQTALELLDLRTGDDEPVSLKAFERQSPDVLLFAWSYAASEAAGEEGRDPAIVDLEDTVYEVQSLTGEAPPVVAVIDRDHLPDDVTPRQARRLMRRRLRESDVPDTRFRIVESDRIRQIDAELVEMAPMEARLQLAQVVETPESKERLARLIIRSTAGVAATIATIPTPVADIIPITSAQILMIATIAHLGGHQFRLETVGEFMAAAGINVGAGYALREVARAIVQFVPFAGSVVSSGIATAATFALGNAAVRYFIQGDEEEFEVQPAGA